MSYTHRNFMQLIAVTVLLIMSGEALAASQTKPMDIITALETRRSARHFTPESVSDNDIAIILRAAMTAPSAANQQPWDFVVIRNNATLQKIGEINRYAAFAKNAPLAILVCLNQSREKIKGMGIIDVAMSAENMLLAAHGLGLGGVFTGIYPVQERMQAFQTLLGLPDNVMPVGMIIIGHPEDNTLKRADERYKTDQIHMEKW